MMEGGNEAEKVGVGTAEELGIQEDPVPLCNEHQKRTVSEV